MNISDTAFERLETTNESVRTAAAAWLACTEFPAISIACAASYASNATQPFTTRRTTGSIHGRRGHVLDFRCSVQGQEIQGQAIKCNRWPTLRHTGDADDQGRHDLAIYASVSVADDGWRQKDDETGGGKRADVNEEIQDEAMKAQT